jgi:hypothetical protein
MAVAVVVIVLPAHTTSAATRERPSGLLNTLDVRTLVARSDPLDHDRLFAHFRVLWDRDLTEAERHESMACSVLGNPNRSFDAGPSEHCRQLANLNRRSAKTLRELALYHKQLAEGIPATLPPGAARYEGGAGAPEPTDQELAALAAQARTRTDHLTLEEYLRAVAARHTRTANAHMMHALTYRGGRFAHAAVHHEHVASVAREAARRATTAAERQRQYAALGR